MKPAGTFRKEERGAILVFVAVALVFIIGMTALTFDLGRLAATQTDLQAYSDHVALAAAGELDGGSAAITRATAAAEGIIEDSQTFAEGTRALGTAADYSLRFLTGLPDAVMDPDDDDPVAAFVTTDPAEAVMVEVTATPRTVFLPFGRALAGFLGVAPPNGQIGAVAIAGFTQYACDITPLMFCIPPGWTADANKGSTVLLRSGGQGAGWGPGDFGFLDPSKLKVDPNGACAGLKGVNLDACLIAAHGNLTQCFAQRGVDIEPGQKVGIENNIFNTRFDIFNGIMNKHKNSPEYAPGPHVVSGYTTGGGNSCLKNNPDLSANSMAFPPDDCFSSGGCLHGGRFGDGGWAAGKAAYLDINYGDGPDDTLEVNPNPPSGTTRYEMYLDEIANAGAGDILTGRDETGRHSCSAAPMIDEPERRVFIAAAIDCDENPIGGSASNVPVQEFVKIFLMRPVGDSTSSPPSFDLYVEVIGQAGGGAGNAHDGGVFRDVVQLYR